MTVKKLVHRHLRSLRTGPCKQCARHKALSVARMWLAHAEVHRKDLVLGARVLAGVVAAPWSRAWSKLRGVEPGER